MDCIAISIRVFEFNHRATKFCEAWENTFNLWCDDGPLDKTLHFGYTVTRHIIMVVVACVTITI